FDDMLAGRHPGPRDARLNLFWSVFRKEFEDRLRPEEELLAAAISLSIFDFHNNKSFSEKSFYAIIAVKLALAYLRLGRPESAFQTLQALLKFPSARWPCRSAREAEQALAHLPSTAPWSSIPPQYRSPCLAMAIVPLVRSLHRIDYARSSL